MCKVVERPPRQPVARLAQQAQPEERAYAGRKPARTQRPQYIGGQPAETLDDVGVPVQQEQERAGEDGLQGREPDRCEQRFGGEALAGKKRFGHVCQGACFGGL